MKRFISIGTALVLLGLLGLASSSFATTGGGMSKVEQLRRSVEAIPENLNLRYYLGSALLEAGLFPEAIVELRRAYPAYVDSKEMNYTLAIALYETGDLDSSLLYLEQAEALGALQEPETYSIVNLHYKIGLKYLERSSFREAEQAFLRVLQLGAGGLKVHRSLGDLYNRMGDSDRSLAEFEEYYKLFPEDEEVQKFLYSSYLSRGMELLNTGNTTQAGALFEQAIAMSKENTLATYFMGYLAYKEENYSLAAKTLLPVMLALPEDARNNSAALLYNCAIELSKNDATLQEALDILGSLTAGEDEIFLAGNIQMKLQHYEEALALFEKVLLLNPGHQGALLNLFAAQENAVEQLTAKGQSLLADGRIRDAQEAVDAALKINPSHKRAGLLKGQILSSRDEYTQNSLAEAEKSLLSGAFPEALQQVRNALTMNPELEAGLLLQEKILSGLGQEISDRLSRGQAALDALEVENASVAFEAVLALDPGNAQAVAGREKIAKIFQSRAAERVERGHAALEKGDPVAAIVAFEEALQILPEIQGAREGLLAAHALIEKLVNQKIVTAKEALGNGGYGEALRQLQLARELRETPMVLHEIEVTRAALVTRVSELMASADQAAAKDEFKRSISLLRKILDIDPANADAKSKLAALNRTSASAVSKYLRQAREAMREKKINRALAAYKKVLDLDSANAEAIQGLRDWEEQSGEYLATLEARAAEALLKGDYAQSEQFFREVLTLSPGRVKAQEGIKKLGQLRGEGINPADGERLYLEGIALYTQGRYGEAVVIWKKVLLINPGHVKAGLNVEKAQRKLQSIKERRDG